MRERFRVNRTQRDETWRWNSKNVLFLWRTRINSAVQHFSRKWASMTVDAGSESSFVVLVPLPSFGLPKLFDWELAWTQVHNLGSEPQGALIPPPLRVTYATAVCPSLKAHRDFKYLSRVRRPSKHSAMLGNQLPLFGSPCNSLAVLQKDISVLYFPSASSSFSFVCTPSLSLPSFLRHFSCAMPSRRSILQKSSKRGKRKIWIFANNVSVLQ